MANQNSDILRRDAKLINRAIDKAINNSLKNNVLAAQIAKQIKKRTRLGFGVTKVKKGEAATGKGQDRFTLPALSDSYISQRKGELIFFKRKGKLIGIDLKDQIIEQQIKIQISIPKSKSRANLKKTLAKMKNLLKESQAKARNKLSSSTKAKKSNLTFTGKLLNSMASRARGHILIIFFKENRDDGITNSELIDIHRNRRNFLGLTTPELRKFSRIITKRIRDSIKNSLKAV